MKIGEMQESNPGHCHQDCDCECVILHQDSLEIYSPNARFPTNTDLLWSC